MCSDETDVEIQICEEDDIIEFEYVNFEPRIMHTSYMEQPVELHTYFEEVTSDPFNHYCLNCKQKRSTHFMVWLGAFVCESCRWQFLAHCGGNQVCYIKSIYEEQWDDY